MTTNGGMTGAGTAPTMSALPTLTPIPGAGVFQTASQAHCALLLQRMNDWLHQTIPHSPQLEGIVPMVIQAVRLYRTGQYDACLAHLRSAAEILALVGRPAPIQI